MKKSILREYARLIARSGVNIQPGQEVFITAELDQPEFVKMLVEECYRCKASKVVVDWSYQPLQKLHFRYRTLTSLSKLDNYEEARWQHYVDTIPCRIYLLSEDPDGLNGINQEKMAKSQQRKYPIIKKYRDQIENKYQWCIAAVPGEAWAKKLFPNLRKSQAMEKLWEAILSTSRALEGDPVANWDAHNKDMHDRCAYLNGLHIRELRYKSANGTDFQVGMIPEARFCGGCEKSLQGICQYFASGWNRDGLALRAAGDLIRYAPGPAPRHLMILLTDASPNDSRRIPPTAENPLGCAYEDAAGVTDTAAQVRTLQRQGVRVSAVFMGEDSSAGAAAQIYGKNMARIRGMDQLARAAGRLIQNEIRELGD